MSSTGSARGQTRIYAWRFEWLLEKFESNETKEKTITMIVIIVYRRRSPELWERGKAINTHCSLREQPSRPRLTCESRVTKISISWKAIKYIVSRILDTPNANIRNTSYRIVYIYYCFFFFFVFVIRLRFWWHGAGDGRRGRRRRNIEEGISV